MDTSKYRIAIIGSGPGGLSAAARAAETGVSHILIEAEPHISNTIFRYQKGKHVMAEPGILPLRSPIEFQAGKREEVLSIWQQGIEKQGVNLKSGAEVSAIGGQKGAFEITTKQGETITAENVILGVGVQGNPRMLGIPGETELSVTQYTLDDPEEYEDEHIIVIGGGDAGIENALALCGHNTVYMINRDSEFARAKEANNEAILAKIEKGEITCFYNSNSVKIEALADGEAQKAKLVLDAPDGEAEVPCDRIIVRAGAIPPRPFIESCGIKFPSEDRESVPELTDQYETNVPGIYIIGALGGYPLIKQCMNQGYEVVECIQGNKIEPADEPLLQATFDKIPGKPKVNAAIKAIQKRVPLLSGLTTLQMREFFLESDIKTPAVNDYIFRKDDYTNSFYCIVAGDVLIEIDDDDPDKTVSLNQGKFFGEMSLLSGRRRSATIRAGEKCILIEAPRRLMNKLISSVDSVKRTIDEAFIVRTLQTRFATTTPLESLVEVSHKAQLKQYKAGESLFEEGDEADSLHVIRRGSVTISRQIGENEVVLSYLPAGNYVGEMGIMGEKRRTATVRAATATETIELSAESFHYLVEQDDKLKQSVEREYKGRMSRNLMQQQEVGGGGIISFLVSQGLGEATDVLLIDESLCVRCDNCEKACAETHDGTSRLDREAGPTYASIHVPTSCRHCEHPHCMKDCPPDAIHRAPDGEVFVADNCIGCGNCQRNCPYGVIQMAVKPPSKPGLISWLLFGVGPGPGQAPRGWGKKDADAIKKAVKCDMCKDLAGGAACVRACPTGAALRIKPDQLPDYAGQV